MWIVIGILFLLALFFELLGENGTKILLGSIFGIIFLLIIVGLLRLLWLLIESF